MTQSEQRTGADLLIETATSAGLEVCFANAGTTEIDLVGALTRAPDMKTVLCLFEGVCSGAADAYSRLAGKPALGLYHLGPGFANSLANQHNARRNSAPMINLIGDQASWHLEFDAPLTSDIEALTGWTGTTRRIVHPDDASTAMARSIEEATSGRGTAVSLIVPTDVAWGSTTEPVAPVSGPAVAELEESRLEAALDVLGQPGSTLIVGGMDVDEASVRLLGRIRLATECQVFTNRVSSQALGASLPHFADLAYLPAPRAAALADTTRVVLVGASEPITFFGYEGVRPQSLPEGAQTVQLCELDADLEYALTILADRLGAHAEEDPHPDPLPNPDADKLSVRSFGAAFARSIPEGAIIIGEGLTSAAAYRYMAHQAAPHTLLSILGGAIGGGLPSAVGASVACPERPVLAFQADGSAMYTISALWTMAQQNLDITVVIAANRKYNIIEVELDRAGIDTSNPVARSLVDLTGPEVDFVSIGEGFGVKSRRSTSVSQTEHAIADALAEPGPHLIEVIL